MPCFTRANSEIFIENIQIFFIISHSNSKYIEMHSLYKKGKFTTIDLNRELKIFECTFQLKEFYRISVYHLKCTCFSSEQITETKKLQ